MSTDQERLARLEEQARMTSHRINDAVNGIEKIGDKLDEALDPLLIKVTRHEETLKWLKRVLWVVSTIATGVLTKVAWEILGAIK